jgi:hypothetical protein
MTDELSSLVVAESARDWRGVVTQSLWWCFQARGCDPMLAFNGATGVGVDVAQGGDAITLVLPADAAAQASHRVWSTFPITQRKQAAIVRATTPEGGSGPAAPGMRIRPAAGAAPLPRATIDHHGQGTPAVPVADSMLARLASTREAGCRRL